MSNATKAPPRRASTRPSPEGRALRTCRTPKLPSQVGISVGRPTGFLTPSEALQPPFGARPQNPDAALARKARNRSRPVFGLLETGEGDGPIADIRHNKGKCLPLDRPPLDKRRRAISRNENQGPNGRRMNPCARAFITSSACARQSAARKSRTCRPGASASWRASSRSATARKAEAST